MSGTATGLRAQFPSGPLLDATGEMFPVWRAYFAQLYVRTGGAVGASSGQIQADLDAEEAARQAADLALTTGLAAERAAREAADSAEAAARADADAKLLPLAGGTMTGTGMITLSAGAPTNPRHAVGKGYVDSAVSGVGGVSSFNTRTGSVTLLSGDITGAGGALLASPVFTGNPQVPTATAGDADTTAASTAFVAAAVTGTQNNVGRNLIHNSLFNVAQRGAGPWSADSNYTADRWQINRAVDTGNFNVVALGDTDRTQIGDEAATWNMTSAVTGNVAGYTILVQHIENVRRLAGKVVIVSFWAIASSGALKLGASVDQLFGTGGSPSADVLGNGQSVTLATTWTRYSLTFSLPSVGGKTLGTNGTDRTRLSLWYSAMSSLNTRSGNIGVQSGTIALWGVQLEIGSVATPLEKLDPQQDLANCERMFVTFAVLVPSTTAPSNLVFPTTMRATPVVSGGGAGFATSNLSARAVTVSQTTAAAQTLTFSADL